MQIFRELYEFNEELLLNLKFTREPLDKVASKYKFVHAALKGQKLLDGEAGEVISDYFNSLGTTDAISQIDYLNERKAVLLKMRDESGEEYKKYSSLYVKIFFMLGVLMAVLLA